MLTKKLKEGGKLLEVQLLDHIIITSESYFSFADEGISLDIRSTFTLPLCLSIEKEL